MTDSLTERLAQHLLRPVEAENRERARLHLLDWLGCVAGARTSPMGVLQRAFREDDAVTRAAFLGNVLEMDDVHRSAILHPGPVIWPTVLGMARGPIAPALDAAVRGYEAMIAVGATFDAAHYAHWHNTATAGGFGAAAATASLKGCDPAQTVSALGLAGSVAGGLWQMRHEPVLAKQWHVAHAVRTGTDAAVYASRGLTGPRYVLEGPQGLHAASCEAPKPMVLGGGWRIGEVSFKPWGACRHAHPAIDAALILRTRGALGGEVRVETYADAIAFCDRPDPESVLQAKFSLQHAVAVVMERGEPRLEDFEPDAIAALAGARRRVTVAETPEFSARFPEHFGAAVYCGGESAVLVDARGDPERPLPRDGVIAKARALFAWGGLDDAQARAGIEAALEADDIAPVREWLEVVL